MKRISTGGAPTVLAGGILLGFAPIGLRLGLGDLGPQAIAFWRYAFALPMLLGLIVCLQRRQPRRPNRAVLAAGLCFALDMALWHHSLTLTTVSNATFIVNLGSVGVGIAAWLFLKERPAAPWFLAAGLALAGAAALAFGGGESGQGGLDGDLYAFGAAIMVAGYMLFSKHARASLSGLETIFWMTLVETLLAGFIVAVVGERFLPENPAGFLAPLALAIIVQVMGQGLIVTGIGRTSAALAGVIVLAQPVVAAAISWVIFEETMTTVQMAGAGLILIAVWLAQQSPAAPGPRPLATVTKPR